MNLTRLRALVRARVLLGDRGYATAWRRATWWECALEREGERWIGLGSDRAAAFEHALAQALPSRLARELFDAQVEARVSGVPDSARTRREAIARPGGDAAERGSDTAHATAPIAGPIASDPVHAAPPGLVNRSASPAAPVVASSECVPATANGALAGVASSPPSARAPLLERAELEPLFAAIEERIGDDLVELGLCAPARQRLCILAFVAHVRALESRARDASWAHARGGRIVLWLRRLSRIWWPGMVRALSLEASPRESAGDLMREVRGDWATWTEVEADASAELERLEDEDERLGRGVHGWADDGALDPRPAEPEALFAEIVAQIERRTGPLARPSASRAEIPPPPSELAEIDWPSLAARLRWLRGAVEDRETWGAAMGALRAVAERDRRPGDEAARCALDAQFAPPRSWSAYLGVDPDKKRRQKAKKLLLSELPAASWTDERLRTWLSRCFELEEAFPTARIADCLAEVRERALALESSWPDPSRGERRRLAKLASILRGEPAAAAVEEIVTEPGVPVAQNAVDADPNVVRVLPWTKDKRALFVSNRNDPTIDELIRVRLRFESVDHCEATPTRLDSAAQRILAGSYDVVLAATGFLPHSADGRLQEAARRAGIPYARVGKGRVSVVAYRLAEMGLGGEALVPARRMAVRETIVPALARHGPVTGSQGDHPIPTVKAERMS